MSMMRFNLVRHVVLAPGLVAREDRETWAKASLPDMPTGWPAEASLVYTKRLPMMKARRMSGGARLACEAALAVSEDCPVDAWIFASRHGETARGIKIIESLTNDQPVSPTDFMMSVHNAAVGMLTIEAGIQVPTTSLAAGAETFHMALLEAYAMLATDMTRVGIVDFEGKFDDRLAKSFSEAPVNATYATAWILEKGDALQVTLGAECAPTKTMLPTSLQLAAGLASGATSFVTKGEATHFNWKVAL